MIFLLSPIICLVLITLFFYVMLHSAERRRLFQKNTKEIWQDLSFWLSLLYEDTMSLLITVIAVIVWLILILLRRIPAGIEDIALSFLGALAFPTFIGLIRRFAKYAEIFEKVDYTTLWITEKLIEFIRNTGISSDRKSVVVKRFYDKYPEDFGGIIMGANEKEYIKTLSDLIPLTEDSFFATLRGGYAPSYTISWFFKPSMIGCAVILDEIEKQNYLKSVNEATIDNDKKIRIIILKQTEMGDFCNDDWRERFFSFNTNVWVYLIDPDSLVKNLITLDVKIENTTITHEGETSFIWEDYAIFDEKIVVRHNGRNSLYLGVKDQINKMRLPFKLLEDHRELFNKLDSTGLYNYDSKDGGWCLLEKWDTWKNSQVVSSNTAKT